MKHEIVTRKWYKMYVEFYEGMVFFHTDILKWNKTIKLQYLTDFDAVSVFYPIMYAMPHDTDDKMIKFGSLLGFEVIGTHDCRDGVERKVAKYERGA